jgi:hypothetical protein
MRGRIDLKMGVLFCVVTLGLILLLANGCAFFDLGEPPITITGLPGEGPDGVNLCEYDALWPIKTLSMEAKYIIKGKVAAIRPFMDPKTGVIYTDVDIEVAENIKGSLPGTISVRVLGGQVGNLVLKATHEPRFRVGEEVVLFLTEHSSDDPVLASHLGVVGALKGKLTVQAGTVLEMDLTEPELVARIEAALSGEELGPDPYFTPLADNGEYLESREAELQPFSYSYTEWRWPGRSPQVGYYVYTTAEPRSSVLKAIKAAANSWNKVGSRFQLVYKTTTTRYAGSRDSYNVVEFARSFGATGWPARTLIWAIDRGAYYDIVECDMQINRYYPWAIGSMSGRFDLQNVVTHEFGHFISLNDLYRRRERNMTMYGYVSYGETKKRSLAGPDKQGILHIYGRRK